MKRILLILILCLFLFGTACYANSGDDFITVEATGYTIYDDGCTGIAYDGTPAVPGVTLAVDPDVIPLGSEVYVSGIGWMIAHDIGGAIQGHKIDICFPTKKAAFEWGRRLVLIYVREKGERL